MIYIEPSYIFLRPNLYIQAGVCKGSEDKYKPVVSLVKCDPVPTFTRNYKDGTILLQYPAHVSEITLTLKNEDTEFTKIIS